MWFAGNIRVLGSSVIVFFDMVVSERNQYLNNYGTKSPSCELHSVVKHFICVYWQDLRRVKQGGHNLVPLSRPVQMLA